MRKQLIAWCNTKIVRLDAEYKLFLESDNRKKRIEGLTTLHHQYKAAPTTLRYLQILGEVNDGEHAFVAKYVRWVTFYTMLAMIMTGDVHNRYFWQRIWGYIWNGLVNAANLCITVIIALVVAGWILRHLP